jgi:hypothetical protein
LKMCLRHRRETQRKTNIGLGKTKAGEGRVRKGFSPQRTRRKAIYCWEKDKRKRKAEAAEKKGKEVKKEKGVSSLRISADKKIALDTTCVVSGAGAELVTEFRLSASAVSS